MPPAVMVSITNDPESDDVPSHHKLRKPIAVIPMLKTEVMRVA